MTIAEFKRRHVAATKKWKEENPDRARRHKQRNYELGAKHTHNARQPWSQRDDRRITSSRRPTDRQLAKILGRTVRAIQIHRNRLKEAA